MLENLIYALNGTIPLFLLMVIGFFLKQIKILNEGFLKPANNFNFKVTLPVLLFTDMATADFKDTFSLKLLIFCMVVTTVMFWGIWGLTKLFMKDKSSVGEFVQACYRCSLAVNGMALIESLYGSTGTAGTMILGSVPLFNIYAVLLLQAESPDKPEGSGRMKKALIGIAKNPIIIGILLGLISSLIGIDYPEIIESTLSYVGRIGTPLALICIGAEFDLKSAFSKAGKSVLAAIIKLIVLPAIFIPIAILMGFRDSDLISILIMMAAPTTPVCYIMARQYGHEGTITSSVVGLTTLFSSVTLTFIIFILRTMGYI